MERVLLVDDELDALEVLSWMLGDWGYDVRTAHALEAAVALSGSFRPHVLITDYLLSDALTGVDLIRRLRHEQRDLGAILVTGLLGDQVRAELWGLADVPIVRKPFRAEEIRLRLEHLREDRLARQAEAIPLHAHVQARRGPALCADDALPRV